MERLRSDGVGRMTSGRYQARSLRHSDHWDTKCCQLPILGIGAIGSALEGELASVKISLTFRPSICNRRRTEYFYP